MSILLMNAWLLALKGQDEFGAYPNGISKARNLLSS